MKKVENIITNLQKLLIPTRASYWRTMFFVGIFSWLMASVSSIIALATTSTSQTIATEFLSNMGCIFLIIAVHLWTLEKDLIVSGFPVGSWLTGALFCLWLFGWWLNNLTAQYPALPFITWPLVSASIAVWHKLQIARLNPRIPRLTTLQEVVILSLINVVISCWLNFHFVVQGWLQDYPSLATENLDRSAFIFKIESASQQAYRGQIILNEIVKTLQIQINNKPWPEIEKIVADIPKNLNNKTWKDVRQKLLNSRSTEIKNQIKVNFPKIIEEDSLWYIKATVEKEWDYKLILKATWRGPRSQLKTNEITKTCQIAPNFGPASPPPRDRPQTTVAKGTMKC